MSIRIRFLSHDAAVRYGDTLHRGGEGAWTFLFWMACFLLPPAGGWAAAHLAAGLAPGTWGFLIQILIGIAASLLVAAALLGVGYLAGRDE